MHTDSVSTRYYLMFQKKKTAHFIIQNTHEHTHCCRAKAINIRPNLQCKLCTDKSIKFNSSKLLVYDLVRIHNVQSIIIKFYINILNQQIFYTI